MFLRMPRIFKNNAARVATDVLTYNFALPSQ